MQRFGPSLSRWMKSLPNANGEIALDLTRRVRSVQKKSESTGAKQRKQLTAADHWRTNDLVNLVK
jgi:hypothetical protein